MPFHWLGRAFKISNPHAAPRPSLIVNGDMTEADLGAVHEAAGEPSIHISRVKKNIGSFFHDQWTKTTSSPITHAAS